MKTICIYHSIDLDGWMSAAIVKKWWIESNDKNGQIIDNQIMIENDETDVIISPFGTLSMLGWNYGNDIPDLSEYDSVIICDISFPNEDMLTIANKFGVSFRWIDHHQSKIDEVAKYLGENKAPTIDGLTTRPDYPKQAACELTWKHLFPDNEMPEIVRLLGRYDCFGHKGTNEETKVLEFQYGARHCISSYEEAYDYLYKNLQDDRNGIKIDNFHSTVNNIRLQGKAIYKYLCTEAKWVYKMGKEIVLFEQNDPNGIHGDHRKFLAINRSRFNPVNFGIDYHADGYDGIMSFNYNKDKWTASLYNDNGEIDCSTIAKTLGGGGHKGAAGFVMNSTLEFTNLLGI